MQENLTYVWILIKFGEIGEDREEQQKRDEEWD